mgnify:CR=1 FL=1
MLPEKRSLYILTTYALVLLVVLGTLYRFPSGEPEAVPVFAPRTLEGAAPEAGFDAVQLFGLFRLNLTYRDVLHMTIPGLRLMTVASPSPPVENSLAHRFIFALTNVHLSKPFTLLSSQIPMLRHYRYPWVSEVKIADISQVGEEHHPPAGEEPTPPPEDVLEIPMPEFRADVPIGKPVADKSQVIVGIYHTHNSEAFLPDMPGGDGLEMLDAFYPDPSINIVRVGEELARVLHEKYGIGAAQATSNHDWQGSGVVRLGAYERSEATAKLLLERYPTIRVLLDIHRDGVEREITTVNVNGQEVARILIVLGGDRNLPHPNWEQNYAFARWMARVMEEKYPGLYRGIFPRYDFRYNQHLFPGALLIEIGGPENTLEEALRSAQMLADVLATMVEENLLPPYDPTTLEGE